ncbi:isoprenylcysteine carboxylmethyltransferase family protein [soil metagenome]
MLRSTASLVLIVAFSLVGFGWRTLVQVRRHGDTGWRFDRTGPDRVVGPLLALSFALLLAAPVLALVGGDPWSPGGVRALGDGGAAALAAAVVGFVLVLAGGVVTVVAQLQMGESWRIGVQAGEHTALVTDGLFARVRNPIFTGMVLVAAGTALLVPNAVALAGAALTVATLQAQVRLVEEPHLRSVHGSAYEQWAATAGRFVPGLGHRLG